MLTGLIAGLLAGGAGPADAAVLAAYLHGATADRLARTVAERSILPSDLIEALDQVAKTQVGTVYVVDSFGYFFSEQIHYIVDLFKKHLPGKRLGMHCHNNQQLAFANTIEGIRKDCNLVDGSLFGIGRGAGNCALELIMGFLKNPKFNIEPVFKVIQDYMIPMRKELEWGYIIPYMITGILNRHPRSAIAVRETKNKDKYLEFYNEICDHMD